MAEEVFDIYVMVKETGAVIHASEEKWCQIREVKPGREWTYGFEEMKDQPSPDFDYDEPVLEVEKRNGRLQLTIREYSGRFHVDVFAFNRLIWRDVGGSERKHVGDSVIVEVPKVVVPPPPVPPPVPPPLPPAPPELKPITDRLDLALEKLWDIKSEMVTPVPPVVPPPPVPPLPPPAPIIWKPITDRLDILVIRANTYSVVTIDLSTARPTLTEFTVGGFAMTVFKCTGTMELKLGDVTTDTITVEPLTYPEMIVIDRMDFTRFYVRNTAQPGREAVLIVWRRE